MPKLPPLDANDWTTLAPRYAALLATELTPAALEPWLQAWSALEKTVWEARAWHKRARARDTTDAAAQAAYQHFVTTVFQPFGAVTQQLQTKLLQTAWQPAPDQLQLLRRLRNEASLPRPAPDLLARIAELEHSYFARVGRLQVQLDDQTLTLTEAAHHLRHADRSKREHAWHAIEAAWASEQAAISTLYIELVAVRQQLAQACGEPDYRAYRWREMNRFDYTPADCTALHTIIEAELMPLARQLLVAQRAQLAVETLRPWDLEVDPAATVPLPSFADLATFEQAVSRLLTQLDPAIGTLCERIRAGFLDLGSRPGKMAGGEEWFFPQTGVPYIHLNMAGSAEDALTLIHEIGHGFHDMLSASVQPLIWNMGAPSEFSEFAAITLVALSLPYLAHEHGGFCTPAQAQRLRLGYLSSVIVHWLPSITMLDAFQHWVYTTPSAELSPAALAAQWSALSQRFLPEVDWSGLESAQAHSWQASRLLFSQPFYSLEYVFAHLGALQVWRTAQTDHSAAFKRYQAALALGDTLPLPALFAAAGAAMPWNAAIVRELVAFIAPLLSPSA